MATTYSARLLTNASATGSAVNWAGGRGFFSAVATFGGGSVSLQYLAPDNTTWITASTVAGAAATLTATGGLLFELPPGQIRASVVTATAVYADAARIPS